MSNEDSAAAAKVRLDARRKADSHWKGFLESTPPNVPLKIDNLFGQYHPGSRNSVWSLRHIEIELFCETDNGPRFFAPDETDHTFVDKRKWEFISYRCKNCGARWKMFALLIEQSRNVPSNG